MAELNMEVAPELAALLDEMAVNPSSEPKSLMAQGALKILSMHRRIAELEAALDTVLSVRMIDNLTEAQWAIIRNARGQQ